MRLILFMGAHLLRRRTIGIYIDPSLACNLRCRMCAFSSAEERRNRLHGRISGSALQALPAALMHRALKLQIGCGAEPTVDSRTTAIIAAGRDARIPYISVTTNGQLLTPALLKQYVEAGLHEVTISLHGVEPHTYTHFMPGASYDAFLRLIDTLHEARKLYPALKVRVNYTVNADNLHQLPRVIELFGANTIDIIQARPVQDLGAGEYRNFDLQPLVEHYESTFGRLREICRSENITCLIPERSQIAEAASAPSRLQNLFEQLTYCYVGPASCYAPGFSLPGDTYSSFHRRNHTVLRIIKAIFSSDSSDTRHVTRKLNYRIK